MPCVPWASPASAQPVGVALAEFAAPLVDGFVGDDHATWDHHFLDVTPAQREPVGQPHAVVDDLHWKPVTLVQRWCGIHPPMLVDLSWATGAAQGHQPAKPRRGVQDRGHGPRPALPRSGQPGARAGLGTVEFVTIPVTGVGARNDRGQSIVTVDIPAVRAYVAGLITSPPPPPAPPPFAPPAGRPVASRVHAR
jgi:hypothetical protein